MSMLTSKRGAEGSPDKLSSALKRALVLAGMLLAAMVVFRATPVFAQEGTIIGTVTDPSGAAVPSAIVTVLNTNTGAVRKVTTNSVGYYIAPDLPIGTYTVGAQAKGFKLAQHTNVVLTVAESLTQNFTLELGTAKQTITVEAAPVAVQKNSGAVSTLTTGQQISKLATNGHSFYTLLELAPGVSSMMSYAPAIPTGGESATVSVNGQRQAHNLFLLDGGEDSDRGGAGNDSILPSTEALSEFRTQTSNYSPKYGLSSGGTFTMALKSGTNQFHGEGWEFFRNNWLDANEPSGGVSKLHQNVFGFNVGGPVALNQSGHHNTFFFYNMEWRKYLFPSSLNTGVPNPSIYAGVTTGGNATFPTGLSTTELHTPCVQNLDPALQAKYTGAGLTLSNCPTGGTPTYAAFPNGNTEIPAALIDPNAKGLLSAGIFGATAGLQSSTDPSVDRFIENPSVPTNFREEIIRVDHTFNDKFSVFGDIIAESVNENLATTMWSGDNVPTVGTNFQNPSYAAVFHTTYAISPTLLNEVAFNFDGNRIHILPNGLFTWPGSGAPSAYRVFTGPNVDNRMPNINLQGATGTSYQPNWMPWNNAANDYQIRDDISWVKGNHQLQFGASYAFYEKVQALFANTEGGFGFNGFFTGNDFADFLLGNAQNYSEDAVQDSGHWNNISPAAYINDNWHASRRLTLNLGLRWDGIPHTYESNNRFSNFYPNLWNPACTGANFFVAGNNNIINSTGPGAACFGTSPNSILSGLNFYLNGVGISGQPGIPHGMVNDSWWNFGPRVGFAYDLTGTGKTIVRGGFGVMYERIQGNDMYNGGTNVPFSANYSTNYVSLSNAALNIQTGNAFTIASAPVLVTSFGRTLLNNNYKPPEDFQYSAGVERQLNPKLVLSVEVVGAQSRYQDFQAEYNLPPQSDLASLESGALSWNSVVPYQGFHAIPMVADQANAHYNSLQVYLHGQATKDLSLTAAYTLSKSIDTGTQGSSAGDLGTLSNPYSWGYSLGPSTFDRRSIFVSSFIYNLPFLRHSSNRALQTAFGGWDVSGIVTGETGTPLNITETGNATNNGVETGATNMPNFSGSLSYPKKQGEWFGTSGFSNPAAGVWGNLPFDSVYGPGYYDWDMTLFKEFPINRERGSHLEFRFETFNSFNHVNWSSIGTGFGSGTFGQVTGFGSPRTLELGMRLFF